MSGLAGPAVVVDTSKSPFARLRPVLLTAVTLSDPFWAPRLRLTREIVLPTQYRLLEETGRLDNFRRAAGRKDLPFQGRCYNDSDVYKWLEGAAWSLATAPDPGLAAMADAVIDAISAAQQPDGYLNTYFARERADERWTNLRDMHELYCAGHLIQAAVAHYRASGSDRLLGIARRLAGHIDTVFGPEAQGKRPGTPGHPEIELALVELARVCGEVRYLQMAQFFLDARGHGLIGGSPYHQDQRPFREMVRMTGHAVRALYLNAGATDLYAETGEAALRLALERLWENMVTRQTYVHGGVGSRHEGECFGQDYELPNARAYAETCAAIASVMWSSRMLALEGQARYADVLETALYNGVLCGLSLDGRSYFYVNPLAADGEHCRQPWFSCACCPPNIARLLASLPGYFFNLSEEGLWVHLYAQGTARIVLPAGHTVTLHQSTHYPWNGDIELEVEGMGRFTLFLRVPGWAAGATVEVNGRPWEGAVLPGTYAAVEREWASGDVVRLHLPMPVRRMVSHPYVEENAGRVALMRGPLLYCVEGVDHEGLDLRDLVLPDTAEVASTFMPDLLGGVVTLQARAEVDPPATGWGERLYRRGPLPASGTGRPCTVTAIPYFAWANRGAGSMRVWQRSR